MQGRIRVRGKMLEVENRRSAFAESSQQSRNLFFSIRIVTLAPNWIIETLLYIHENQRGSGSLHGYVDAAVGAGVEVGLEEPFGSEAPCKSSISSTGESSRTSGGVGRNE